MSNQPIVTLPGLQLSCAIACGAVTEYDRRAVDELTAHAVRYVHRHKPKTAKDRLRAEKKIRKRAKAGLIGGGILESIAISLIASFVINVFKWFWNWWNQPASEDHLASMAAALPAWSPPEDEGGD
jgi:hypothetical protein